MAVFFVKRLLMSLLVVLVSTVIMYVLVDLAIDPLNDLRTSTAPNKAEQIQRRIADLNLDQPVLLRYLWWLRDASGCLYGNCDLGENWKTHQAVTSLLSGAVVNTIQLVSAATVLAIVLGVVVGIVSALRQYTGFDYSITFLSFLLYSLPVFWVAVLAKVFLAIDFNDFLADPHISIPVIICVCRRGRARRLLRGGRRSREATPQLRDRRGRRRAVPRLHQHHRLVHRPVDRHRADRGELRGLGLPDHLAEHWPAQSTCALLRSDGGRGRDGAVVADALRVGLGAQRRDPRLAVRDRDVPHRAGRQRRDRLRLGRA